jgi:predicted lipoprotein
MVMSLLSFSRCATLVLGLLGLVACVDSSRAPTPSIDTPATRQPVSGFDTNEMVTHIADEVIAVNYEVLASVSEDFAASDGPVEAFCDAVGTALETDAKTAVEAGWRSLMSAVQHTEMHAIGPVLGNDGALRSRVNSWSAGPLSTCGVDLAVVLSEGAGFDINTRALNQRGVGALEYLLFNDSLVHSCAPQVPATQSWNTLSRDEQVDGRCRLARMVADDVAAAAATTLSEWRAYRESFVDPSNSGNAVQLLTDALFSLESLVKDQKLGVATGLDADCSAIACPEAVESPYLGNTFTNVRDNVLGFLAILKGGAGTGFDDLIAAREFGEVAARFNDQSNQILAVIDAAEAPLIDEVIALDNEQGRSACVNAAAAPDVESDLVGCRLVGLLKRVSDDLKIDFVTIVGVSIPDGVQSDND